MRCVGGILTAFGLCGGSTAVEGTFGDGKECEGSFGQSCFDGAAVI